MSADKELLELASLWLDEEADHEEQDALDALRREDPGFDDEVKRLEAVTLALRSLPMESAPNDLAARVKTRIRRRTRGRYFGTRVRYRFPYEAVINGVLLAVLMAVYLIAVPTAELTAPHIDAEPYESLSSATVGVSVLSTYGDVVVDRVSDKYVDYRVDVAQERVHALLAEISLYPELQQLGDPEVVGETQRRVIVRAPRAR